jgi:hypothetical protein
MTGEGRLYGRANAGGNQIHRNMTLRERKRLCRQKHRKSWRTKTLPDGTRVVVCLVCGGTRNPDDES